MRGVWQDLRYAVRTVRRQPGFAATIVLTLALGIAVNTTVFTIVNAVALRPLPFESADRIVQLNVRNVDNAQNPVSELSYLDFQEWQSARRTFEQIAATEERPVGIADDVRTATLVAARVRVVEYLLPDRSAASARPRFHPGRTIGPERRPLSSWAVTSGVPAMAPTRRFSDGPSASTGSVHGRRHNAAGRWFSISCGILAASRLVAADRTDVAECPTTGRLRTTPTWGDHRAGLDRVDWHHRVPRRALPGHEPEHCAFCHAVPHRPGIRGRNAGSARRRGVRAAHRLRKRRESLLARAADRSRDVTLRMALGASRWRVVRQLLVEVLLLAAAGGVVGLALSYPGLEMLRNLPARVRATVLGAVHPRSYSFSRISPRSVRAARSCAAWSPRGMARGRASPRR